MPGARGRGEVEDPAGLARQPFMHVGVFVGGVVVEDQVDHLAGRNGPLDGVQEAEELLVPVARHALADHRAVEDVERGEQGGGAMALVVVGHGAEATGLHRQARLGAVERLDLRFYVHREDHRMGQADRRRGRPRPRPCARTAGSLDELEPAYPVWASDPRFARSGGPWPATTPLASAMARTVQCGRLAGRRVIQGAPDRPQRP